LIKEGRGWRLQGWRGWGSEARAKWERTGKLAKKIGRDVFEGRKKVTVVNNPRIEPEKGCARRS